MSSNSKKKEMVAIKDLETEDWRGIFAAIIIVGTIVVVCLSLFMGHPEWSASMTTLATAVVMYYFHVKEKEKECHT